MPSSEDSRAFMTGKWLLAAVVPASAMIIGSLHTPVLVAVATAAAIACALLWSVPPRRSSRSARAVMIAFVVLAVITTIQSIPLPASVVATLAPSNADVWARALGPLREAGPSWHPISVAPVATHVELLRGMLYGCVFLGALRIAFEEGGVGFLERVVVGSAAVVALVSLAHSAVHAERVFGIYRPRDGYAYYENRLGPLLNPNHLAAYLNVGAFVAVGTALSRRGPLPRSLAIGAVILLAGTAVWAGSRGGTGSLVVGVVLVSALVLYSRGTIGVRRTETALTLVAFVAAGALIAIGASDSARGELADRDTSKLTLALETLRLVPSSPLFGVGRGAFETVFPSVREGVTYVTFLRTENVVAQWAIEWGVPAALAAAVLLAVAFRPTVVLTAARPPVGAWVAVIVAVLHDLVDFHLEVPGVVVLVTVCAAIVVGARTASPQRRGDRAVATKHWRTAAFGCAAGTIVAALVVVPNVTTSLPQERETIARMAVDTSIPADGFRRAIRTAMLRYPAEPFFPLAGAIRAQATGDESVVPWTARALERYPRFGRAHLVLARSLGRARRAQARLEYRLAYENDTALREPVLREAVRLVDGPLDALELVPEGPAGVPVLETLASVLQARLPATSAQLDAELDARQRDAPGVLRRRVAASLSDLTHAHPWCAKREPCVRSAVESARALVAREPDKCQAHVLLARVRIAAGDASGGLEELEKSVDRLGTERAECQRELVSLSFEAGQRAKAAHALDRLVRGGCGSSKDCIDLYAWAGATEEQLGNSAAAVALYKHAVHAAPEREDLLERIGELASRVGMFADAIEAYTTLSRRAPGDPRWPAKLAELNGEVERRRLASPR